jgi:hypothetical protein
VCFDGAGLKGIHWPRNAAQFFDGQFAEAVYLAERVADEFPTFAPAMRIMAVSYALAVNLALAEKAAKKSHELDPSQRIAALLSHMPLRRVEDRNLWEQGLRFSPVKRTPFGCPFDPLRPCLPVPPSYRMEGR